MSDTHTITIEPDGIWHHVRVKPPCPPFDFDLRNRDLRYARSYAASLSKARRWPIVDLTAEVQP